MWLNFFKCVPKPPKSSRRSKGRRSSNRNEKPRRKADPDPKECPDEYLCPITMDIMTDPVAAADGHSYERSVIEDWLKNHTTSPITNVELEHKILFPNHALKGQFPDYMTVILSKCHFCLLLVLKR
jgi:hypothetical protein